MPADLTNKLEKKSGVIQRMRNVRLCPLTAGIGSILYNTVSRVG